MVEVREVCNVSMGRFRTVSDAACILSRQESQKSLLKIDKIKQSW